ncbi:hypothetical protein RQP46_005040 [Phenoliferia psychrophenolica]
MEAMPRTPPISLGLARIQSLLSSLQNPHLRTPIVHIAGTNGKGSVSAYLSSILTHSSLRVGRFNSPHLVHEWDCVHIGGSAVSEACFRAANDEVVRVDREGGIGATSFELLTATAFEVFRRASPPLDLAVVEVGMGGRTDATNVVDPERTLLSIVTSIELDHQKFLGDTVTEIARVKTGIAKAGGDVVLAKQAHPEVEQVLGEVVEELGAKAWIAGEATVLEEGDDVEGGAPLVSIPTTPLRTTSSHSSSTPTQPLSSDSPPITARLPLPGSYQLANAAAATLAATVLSTSPRTLSLLPSLSNITQSTITSGIEATRWPGRLDWLSLPSPSPSTSATPRKILLDGAHNPSSATSLALYLESLPAHRKPTTLILALSAPRSPSSILTPLLDPPARAAPSSITKIIAVTFTEPPSMPWIKPVQTDEIVRAVQEMEVVRGAGVDVRSCEGGVREALDGLEKGEKVLVAGTMLTTTHLPAVRRTLILLTATTGSLGVISVACTLAFQLSLTSGYQQPLPAIMTACFLGAAFPLAFLFTKPFGGTARLAVLVRSIAAELVCYGGCTAFVLTSVSSLYAETPGLINQCGGYAICRLLLCVVALAYLTFLSLATLAALLLVSTLYYSIRRKMHITSFLTPFADVEWDVYETRLPRGTGAPALTRGMSIKRGLSLKKVEPRKTGREIAEEREKREMEKEDKQVDELEVIVGEMGVGKRFLGVDPGCRDSQFALFD